MSIIDKSRYKWVCEENGIPLIYYEEQPEIGGIVHAEKVCYPDGSVPQGFDPIPEHIFFSCMAQLDNWKES